MQQIVRDAALSEDLVGARRAGLVGLAWGCRAAAQVVPGTLAVDLLGFSARLWWAGAVHATCPFGNCWLARFLPARRSRLVVQVPLLASGAVLCH